MSVDPASWQPGTLIVNRDDMLVAHVDERGAGGWHVFVADMEIAVPEFMSDAELAAEWQPLADVVARGWEQRQEVPVRWYRAEEGADQHLRWVADPDAVECAPVSEVRTGPLGLSDGDEWRTAMTRDEWRVHRDRWLPFLTGCSVGARMSAGGRSIWDKLNDDCPGGFWQSGGNTVSAVTLLMLPDATSFTPWDAEDAAPAETLADIVAEYRQKLERKELWSGRAVSYLLERIEDAAGLSVPSEGGEP